MGKRGQKPYEERTKDRVMPVAAIAARTGLSVRTVDAALSSAIRKLKKTPGAFEALLAMQQGIRTESKEPIQCASVECRPEYRNLHGRD